MYKAMDGCSDTGTLLPQGKDYLRYGGTKYGSEWNGVETAENV
jgi:hypothetical protein